MMTSGSMYILRRSEVESVELKRPRGIDSNRRPMHDIKRCRIDLSKPYAYYVCMGQLG